MRGPAAPTTARPFHEVSGVSLVSGDSGEPGAAPGEAPRRRAVAMAKMAVTRLRTGQRVTMTANYEMSKAVADQLGVAVAYVARSR